MVQSLQCHPTEYPQTGCLEDAVNTTSIRLWNSHINTADRTRWLRLVIRPTFLGVLDGLGWTKIEGHHLCWGCWRELYIILDLNMKFRVRVYGAGG